MAAQADPLFALAQTDRLLTTTRAVRRRLDLERPVELPVVIECLRLATHAPNASNTQLWRWLVIADPDKRAQVAAVYRGLFENFARAGASGPDDAPPPEYASDPAMLRTLKASAYLAQNLHRVPVLVIPCYLERPQPESGNVGLATLYGSIIQATWSFQLALRSRGLGSVWTTMHLHSERDVAAVLGIPEDVTQVAMIPVAYTRGTDFGPPPRQPVDEVTYVDAWGTRA